MPTTTEARASGFTTDAIEARDNTIDAYRAIEALQACDVWLSLPPDVRRQLSAAHATLGCLATGLERWA